jgi:catechol 2,3-dioxygenase-like lactoylglutathione lyase family enzyme
MSTSPLGSQNVVTFIPTLDIARAKAFYAGTLGLRLISEDSFATVFDVNGIMLRVTPAHGWSPARHTVLGWNVKDISATAQALEQAGVKFQRYPGLTQDELGIWTAPGGARVAWFEDPDGNILSLTQFA